MVTGSREHRELSRAAAAEGMVLLKNENHILPLKSGCRVALFGCGQIDFISGGGGSGTVYSPYTVNILDGLVKKSSEGKLQLYKPLYEFYQKSIESELQLLKSMGANREALARLVEGKNPKEPEIPQHLFEAASENADTAIICIRRYSCEAYDHKAEKGDYYLSDDEKALVDRVKNSFEKIVVLLNIGGVTDTSWFNKDPKIQAAMIIWQPGMEGGNTVADILCGEITPSGKLVDTFAASYMNYPCAENFSASEDCVIYDEDIFVGYRYFETFPEAKKKVNYCFGHGLSYTDFLIDTVYAEYQDNTVSIRCTVKNIGKYIGKEVVQVYLSCPKGVLGKPEKQLAAFCKTDILQPDNMQELTIRFDLREFASFDDLGKIREAAFVLEKGDYSILIGTSVQNCKPVLNFSLKETTVVKQSKHRAAPKVCFKRMLANGRKEQIPAFESEKRRPLPAPIEAAPPSETATVFDLAVGNVTVDEFVAQMTTQELGYLLSGHPGVSASGTNGFGGMGRASRLMMPLMITADGPAGLRIVPERGGCTTSFPCATMMACSFNEKLTEAVAVAGAREVKENNIAVWLTPALNIHRSPLCGRNFEYFSEDPLIAGKMAAAVVRGIQSQRIAATVKHFSCNDKETNRRNSDSIVSERALREIYLKGFEISIKEASPWCVMTAYNLVNGVRSSQQYDLIEGILREEWGFQGLVMTDWCVFGSQIDELESGNDVRMPESLIMESKTTYDVGQLIAEGQIPLGVAQRSAKRVIELLLKLE